MTGSISKTRRWARAATTCLIAMGLLLPSIQASAVAQRLGDFEMAFDAPWRMEPEAVATRDPDAGPPVACEPEFGCEPAEYTYGAIPIQITILDADLPNDLATFALQRLIKAKQDGAGWGDFAWHFFRPIVVVITLPIRLIGNALGLDFFLEPSQISEIESTRLDHFRYIAIYEDSGSGYVRQREYAIEDLHEVEITDGIWRWAPGQESTDSGNTPPPRPWHTLCRGWDGDDCSDMVDLRGTSEWHAILMYEPREQRTGKDIRLKVTASLGTKTDGNDRVSFFSEHLSVHLGEAPLPRFDERWIYGDLHYHSQGSDNDGESAYSYRGTLQAMSALGMDFAFATDHTSNSRQIMSARAIPTAEFVQPIFRGLRDLSPDRYAFGIDLMNGPRGANREALSFRRERTGQAASISVPQLFLGSEVDVIPEFEPLNPPTYSYVDACRDVPAFLKALTMLDRIDLLLAEIAVGGLAGRTVCDGFDLLDAKENDRYLIRDLQGPANGALFSTSFYGRQHLLALPEDPQRHDTVVLGNTSKYGGATRRLEEVLEEDFARDRKGAAFLAHPFSRTGGSGFGRLGPDIVPFSDAQLEDAFASQDILGIQIWNSNGQQSTSMGEGDAYDNRGVMIPVADLENWRHHERNRKYLNNDLAQWDRLLLWSIDPDRVAAIDWLAPGEPRRFFMAGGSDAHGDFNYRREGYFVGNDSITDTALGTPRNLVFAGTPDGDRVDGPDASATPHSQQQVVAALRAGNFAVTDGPAVRIVYDQNRNGEIDDWDVQMGGFDSVRGCDIPILVEWLSTLEFGRVETIDLTLGVASDEHGRGMLYQAAREVPSEHLRMTWTDLDGKDYHQVGMYWTDPSLSTLSIDVSPEEGYGGLRRIVLHPADFPVAMPRLVCDEELAELQAAHEAETESDDETSYATATWTSTSAQFGSTTMTNASRSGRAGSSEVVPSSTTALSYRTNGGYTDHEITTEIDPFPGSGGGFPWENGPDEPPVLCPNQLFGEPLTPDRFFVRAEVRNANAPHINDGCNNWHGNQCIFRKAYSNPIWINYDDSKTSSWTCFATNQNPVEAYGEASAGEPTPAESPATNEPVQPGTFETSSTKTGNVDVP